MAARPFPQEWLTPTPEAYRAAAALAEGFCPYPHCGYPFDEGGFCPVCGVTWELTPDGLSGRFSGPKVGGSTSIQVYPFATWPEPPVIDLGNI